MKKKHEYTFSVSAELLLRVKASSLEEAAHKINHKTKIDKMVGGCLIVEATLESFNPTCIMRDWDEYDMGRASRRPTAGTPSQEGKRRPV